MGMDVGVGVSVHPAPVQAQLGATQCTRPLSTAFLDLLPGLDAKNKPENNLSCRWLLRRLGSSIVATRIGDPLLRTMVIAMAMTMPMTMTLALAMAQSHGHAVLQATLQKGVSYPECMHPHARARMYMYVQRCTV